MHARGKASVARGRRWRGQRGVAMVEAVAILPLFVVLWFTLLYAFHVSSDKISVNTSSRALAWGYVMANCHNPSGPHVTTWPGVNANNGTSTDTSGVDGSQVLGGPSGGGSKGMGVLFAAGSSLSGLLGPAIASDTESKVSAFNVMPDGVATTIKRAS